jgi:predicted Fe-Mo cluster-binding NifX family protein
MNVCFPVARNEGLQSKVYGHFGSAPLFVVVDTESGEVREVLNRDQHHTHGACQPVRALGGEAVDAVVVGGIGAGALNGLTGAGLDVFRAEGATIAENISRLKTDSLPRWTPGQVCAGHGHGHGCGH